MSENPYLNEADGTPLYVVTEQEWGRSRSWLVPAESLKAAKEAHGWTRARYTSRTVRRARQSDADLAVRS